jgi:hypothetical protein
VWLFLGKGDRKITAADVQRAFYSVGAPDERRKVCAYTYAGHHRAFWNAIYARAEVYEWLLNSDSAEIGCPPIGPLARVSGLLPGKLIPSRLRTRLRS